MGDGDICVISDIIMSAMASQIISISTVCSAAYSGTHQRIHQSSASLAFVAVDSPHKWPVTRKMFPFDDVIMCKNNKVLISLQQSL